MTIRSCVLVVLLALLATSSFAVTTGRVTCATTATLVYTAPAAGTGRVLVRNTSPDTAVFLGPAGVTTANGFSLAFGDAVGIDLSYGDTLYCIVAAGTQPLATISGANPQ